MNYNLALLTKEEKQKIELDKQASFTVWQIKHSFSDKKNLSQKIQTLSSDEEREYFIFCIEKYQTIMAV